MRTIALLLLLGLAGAAAGADTISHVQQGINAGLFTAEDVAQFEADMDLENLWLIGIALSICALWAAVAINENSNAPYVFLFFLLVSIAGFSWTFDLINDQGAKAELIEKAKRTDLAERKAARQKAETKQKASSPQQLDKGLTELHEHYDWLLALNVVLVILNGAVLCFAARNSFIVRDLEWQINRHREDASSFHDETIEKLDYAAYKREKAEERQVRLLRKVNRSVQKISEDADYLSCYRQRFRRKPHI